MYKDPTDVLIPNLGVARSNRAGITILFNNIARFHRPFSCAIDYPIYQRFRAFPSVSGNSLAHDWRMIA